MSRSTWAVFLAAIFGITSLSFQKVLSCIGRAYNEPQVKLMTQRPPGDQLVRVGGEVFANTSGIVSVKLSDLPVGKVIRVGELKFVKVGQDQYLSLAGCVDPVLTTTGASKNFDYTGSEQTYTAYTGCVYKLEVWGAQGGVGEDHATGGGLGGYSVGTLTANNNIQIFVYVGQQGYECYGNKVCDGTFGGGGSGEGSNYGGDSIGVGGGASDIRLNYDSLYARVLVAGGGGGAGEDVNDAKSLGDEGGYGGGDSGGSGRERTLENYIPGGTQISGERGGAFGQGAYNYYNCGGGGGGWYGGGSGGYAGRYGQSSKPSGSSGGMDCSGGGGGGSGWVYTESTYTYWKNNSTEGKSGNWLLDSTYYLTNASTIAGSASIPNPRGSGTIAGNSGHGYARITRLN